MNNLKKIYENYLSNEYRDAKLAVFNNCESSSYSKEQVRELNKNIIDKTISRCLGVALFIQYLDLPFKYVDKKYMDTKEKLEELLRLERVD